MISSQSISARRSGTRFAPFAALLTAVTLLSGLASVSAQTPTPSPTAPAFSQILVFGDSLSDVGNLRDRMEDRGVNYPGGEYNYSDGRFTNSSDTDPGSDLYVGVWHEQLSRTFLGRTAETPSHSGGNVFAFGGATTEDGTKDFSIIGVLGNDITVTIDNIGQQVDDYITRRGVDPNALFVIWGGGNDLINDDSADNVSATAGRVAMLMSRLADAGARNFMIPNVPPLGAVPRYGDDGEVQATKHAASAAYRAELASSLDAVVGNLAAQGIQAQLYRLDIWSLFVREVAAPQTFNFTDIYNPARGADVDPDTFLFWDDIHPTTAAHYQIALEANRVLTGEAKPPSRAVNVSTRVTVGSGENIAVGGFIVQGTQAKRVVLRGVGPSLATQGVQGSLSNPALRLFDSGGILLAANDDWETSARREEIAATGLAPTDPREAAIIANLAPGSYTVQLSGVETSTGVGLVEVYDVNSAANSTLANLSSRGAVGTGDQVMIGGIIIDDDGGEAIVVLRAIGPSLAAAGVAAPLQDPVLDLYNSNGEQIATNDSWGDGFPVAARATLLAPGDLREAVIAISLTPGNYTAVVRGKDNTTGVALVEVYRLP